MIKIDKPEKVPDSLNGTKTIEKRNEIIKNECFPNKKNINSFSNNLETYGKYYKTDDIKKNLKETYSGKCCYCEQKIEQFPVEHYRPKSIYYWLAYSWDNLLFCCPKCNEYKSNKFEVERKVSISDFDISNIHKLRDLYDDFEKPTIINPEKENITNKLSFTKDGNIFSTDERVSKTIKSCKIDRDDLNERRSELYKDFEGKITSRLFEIKNGNIDSKIKLDGFIEDFKKDSENTKNDFLAFRRYILKYFLREIFDILTIK